MLASLIQATKDNETLLLRKLPQGENAASEATILLLLGHDALKGDDMVGASALLRGLKLSGITNLDRIDRAFEPVEFQPMVHVSGNRRGRKYGLTTLGKDRAKQIATKITTA